MKWKHLPIIAFDTETTGLNPFGGDRMIEFGAVVLQVDDSGAVVSREDHSWLVNPGIPVPRKVTEITGISDADLAGKPSFDDIADQVHALLSNAVTVAHNYPFDLAFLTVEFQRLDRDWPEPLAQIDTVDLSIKHFPDAKGHKLSQLCQRLNVSLDNAHRATDDAAACGHCLTTLARRHDVPDDLQELLDWARAIGRPPESGPLSQDHRGRLIFRDGPYQGDAIGDHPVHLAWMEKARVMGPEGWRWRFPESTRRWVRRWLEVRGAGRAKQHPKSFRSEDWVIDSCVAD